MTTAMADYGAVSTSYSKAELKSYSVEDSCLM